MTLRHKGRLHRWELTCILILNYWGLHHFFTIKSSVTFLPHVLCITILLLIDRATIRSGKHSPHTTDRRRDNLQPARCRRAQLQNIARSTSVMRFEECTLPGEMGMLHCGSLFDTKCPHCQAFWWPAELLSFCCPRGTVVVDQVRPPPSTLRMLHTGLYREAYLSNISPSVTRLWRASNHRV